ncbi:hypothetical protein PSTT_16469 [Puccinia striiformis]|uniref:ATP citrate synthase n=1 Tax=Puccinia striiformis TaxID=27350 RepID=A0A2S4UCP3_9BASI|nr:hypothetical protein PSTT_16469 [Puccinia striiformis]
MSAKAIREYDAKLLVAHFLGRAPQFGTACPARPEFKAPEVKVAQISWDPVSNTITPDSSLPSWVFTEKLVVKPDQLIKRRGKAGLLGLNKTWAEAKAWIEERAGKPVNVEGVLGTLNTFIVEPFAPHPSDTEYYVCINSVREGDMILFTHEGGVDIGDVDAKAAKITVPVDGDLPDRAQLKDGLLAAVPTHRQDALVDFLVRLYSTYVDLHYTYLEINPLVCMEAADGSPSIAFLDMAAKLDQTADYLCGAKWAIGRETSVAVNGSKTFADRGPPMVFPAPFGRDLTKEEAYIQKLDASTGASLKLTVLNAQGRVWTMVAGGGASVVYSDAIAAHGFAHELANYGEYSGAPTKGQTFEYAKTILDLMTRGDPHPEGKVLIIGGGIANFTNEGLQRHKVKIFVRRGGPNYQEGLKKMRLIGETIGIEIQVFGPDTHISSIVPMALGITKPMSNGVDSAPNGISATHKAPNGTSVTSPPSSATFAATVVPESREEHGVVSFAQGAPAQRPWFRPFDETTRGLVYGLQPRAIQGMLDFDFACGRKIPSVAAMIYPLWWPSPVKKHPEADTLVNFSSSRSVYQSTLDALEISQIKSIALIAEGVPERHAREILHLAEKKKVIIIGPATVGGIKPGCFRIGNTGGMMDNIIASKLYRPGSVAYVSKSGGMSNELNNILSLTTNGTYEGIAIGGDRYPGTTFIDHMLRYEADPNCKMLVLLGEVGGVEEYRVIEAVKSGQIKKPIVAWAIGTCAKMFTTEVQFGHAGSMANSDLETADAKNKAMRAAGFVVPDTFEDLPAALKKVYTGLVQDGTIKPSPERDPPNIPVDYKWAQELGMVRKPAAFISTISDERGAELLFKRRLPAYACKFLEMCLQLTADHGPAVSGAMTTVITTRAGKDLVSSLVAGLLTIGDRFGGALDGAAREFSRAKDTGLTPREFVDSMRRANKLIPGIGHKIKSKANPDMRVELVKDFAKKNFPSVEMLDYALAVEDVTSSKKDTLILNVDGCIAVCFCDLLRNSGAFSREEADEYMQIGTLNALFVLGRSIGFIGHHIDQKRLKQGLYRAEQSDIFIEMGNTGISDRVVVRPS